MKDIKVKVFGQEIAVMRQPINRRDKVEKAGFPIGVFYIYVHFIECPGGMFGLNVPDRVRMTIEIRNEVRVVMAEIDFRRVLKMIDDNYLEKYIVSVLYEELEKESKKYIEKFSNK